MLPSLRDRAARKLLNMTLKIIGSFSEVSKLCLQAVPSLSENRVPTVLGSIIAMLTLATLAVMLRLIARRASAMMFGIDDVLIMLALVLDSCY